MTLPKGSNRSNLRSRAYEILGVDPNVVAEAPKITHWISSMKGGKTMALRYLRSSDIPEARAFMSKYDNLLLPSFVRHSLPIEAFCIAAGISPTRLCGVIVEAGRIYESGQGALRAASHHPDIVEASVQAALSDSTEDRMAQLKHMGFMPLPKGSQVNVQVHANALAQAEHKQLTVQAPPTETVIRRMANRFNESRHQPALPSGITGQDLPNQQVLPPSKQDAEPLDSNFVHRQSQEVSVMEDDG